MTRCLYLKLLLLVLILSAKLTGQRFSTDNYPLFTGAEVFVEPGQTAAQMDTWFQQMQQYNFKVCRIRMFEAYMKDSLGNRDFELFDMAFEAAARHGVKVFINPFPATSKTDIGGFKFPRDNAHLIQIAEFLKDLVLHFKNKPNLAGYVLINEPGSGKVPDNEFAKQRFETWKQQHKKTEYGSGGYPVLVDLSENAFLKELNTWYLQWIANEIARYDTTKEIHVNNHAIFNLAGEYDFPAWRKFLTSLGGSAHAGWHFGYFDRKHYPLAVAANAEIIRSGAGNLPWWMTELQGGNNTYSATKPLCPTKDEITQWMWLVTAAGGKGSMFWCLNPRSSGIEAGEWALLDYQNNATDRMQAASRVNSVIQNNHSIFESAKPIESGISVLYIRESLWAEEKLATKNATDDEARQVGAVMKSALGYFETLSMMGVNARLMEFEEFDFQKTDFSNEVIIIANQIVIPEHYIPVLEKFVAAGGKLIIDGLSGFYDENLICTHTNGFRLHKLLGGFISEYKTVAEKFSIDLNGTKLPAGMWKGIIKPSTAVALNVDNEGVLAARNKFGRGEVVWIPGLAGLESRKNGYKALADFLSIEIKSQLVTLPVKLTQIHQSICMKTMQNGERLIAVVVNMSDTKQHINIQKQKSLNGHLLFADKPCTIGSKRIALQPQSTLVICFQP
jgi:beta-galactosidase